MNRPAKTVLLGMLTGLLGILASCTPFALGLEEKAGLDWLFTLRGPRTPPSDVVVVAVDKLSADMLGLSNVPAKWPRAYHAQLVDRLTEAGAAVIVLDIFFEEPRAPRDDAALASAIGRAGDVVLFAYTKKEITPLAGKGEDELIVQRLVPPVAQLATQALASAPFPLPVFPVKVSQFWTFTPGTGDLPTLPLVALQHYAAAVYPDLLDLLDHSVSRDSRSLAGPAQRASGGADSIASMQAVRAVFRQDPTLAQRMSDALSGKLPRRFSPQQRRLLRALIGMYGGGDSRYLNFYGPAQTITTLPYVRVLRPEEISSNGKEAVDLRGKAVFVGYSERLQPERLDEFYTVYSQRNGVHLSGVEIAATAFANLLENLPVTPLSLPAWYFLIFTWGLLIGALVRQLPVLPAVAATVALAGLYLGIGTFVFGHSAIWLPLMVPLFIQAPFALFSTTLWHYLEVRREREHIRTAFGLYLPSTVVDTLASDLADGRAEGQLLYGTCLYSDVGHYTRLSESMAPGALAGLMNSYYESLFQPVRRHDGIISDIVGDAMLAIWTSRTPDNAMRRHAIEAALEIDANLNRSSPPGTPWVLATRLGLHSGEILLGSIGAIDHYEYRAVGDIVNSANRIQGLNKTLGTRVLLSQEVLEGAGGLLTREVGTFLLRGKTRPLVIHELLGARDAVDAQASTGSNALFAEGLTAFRQAHWKTAIEIFTHLTATRESDGVSRFYLDLSLRHQQHPPSGDWNGVIRLDGN
jgi:adenylate cyclase